MKRKTVIIIVIFLAIVIIGVSAWLIYKNTKKDEFKDPYEGGDEPLMPPVGGGGSPSKFPISRGMSGPEVTTIQDSINKKCKANLATDGKFGPLTENALKSCYGTTSVSQALFNQMKSDTGSPISGMPITPPSAFTANQKIYLKGSAANIYSYPAFANNYIVGTLEKSFFLDKSIGLYIAPATGGFSKIKVFGYKPYGSPTYKVETREVYIATTSISKTPY